MASASHLFSPSSMGISGSGLCWGRRRNRLIGIRCSMLDEHSAVGSSSSPKPRFPRIVGKGSKLIGCGSAVPKLSIANDDLAEIVETSDEWISVRTGIRKRRILSGDETLTDLAAEAARKALDMAKVEALDVDLILMCTSTPDDLFGTGPQASKEDDDGLLGFDLRTDGQGQRHLHATLKADSSKQNGAAFVPPKPSSYSCIQMNGKEVFRFAVRCVPEVIEAALSDAGLSSADISWLLLHQANQRIIDAVATRLQIQNGRVLSNLSNYGNTSAASIPLALDEAIRGGQVQQGDVIATAGFGAGLTWGAAIVKWG